MIFNTTFNNISVMSWRSVLLVEKPEYPKKKPTDLPKINDKLYHIMLYRGHLAWAGFELTTWVVINTDSIGSLYMTLCLTYKQYIVSCLSNDKIIQTPFFTRDMIWLLKYIVNSLNLRFCFIKQTYKLTFMFYIRFTMYFVFILSLLMSLNSL